MPKRLRALRFRTVDPWLHLGSRFERLHGTATCTEAHKKLERAKQTRFVRVSTARCPRRAGSGKPGPVNVIGKRQGLYAFARRNGARGGRGGDLVDVPVRHLSLFCRSRQAVLAQRSPSPERSPSKEGWE